VSIVFHCAADTSSTSSNHDIRAANVLATTEVIRFSIMKCQYGFGPIPINQISTISVFGPKEHLRRLGTNAKSSTVLLSNGYAQSKWVAEKLIEKAHGVGVPALIFRSGYISWSSQVGCSNRTDWLSRFFYTCLKLNAFPKDVSSSGNELSGVNISPVDLVSGAISSFGCRILENQTVIILKSTMASWFEEYRPSTQFISRKQWCSRVQDANIEEFLSLLPIFERSFPRMCDYRSEQFQEDLSNLEGRSRSAAVYNKFPFFVPCPSQSGLEITKSSFFKHLHWLESTLQNYLNRK
jgi:nonribosomal peptide synthetase MxcG